MPELPPIQLYAILAVAVTIGSIFSAFIREPTTTIVSRAREKVMLGLLIFYFSAWVNVIGLVFYLLICVSRQILSFDQSLAVHIFDFIVHIFHFGVLVMGLYVSTLICKEMWTRYINGDVSAP